MLRFAVLVVLGMSAGGVVIHAQCTGCDSLVQAVGDSSMFVSTYNAADYSLDTSIRLVPSSFCPSYSYEYETDSTHTFWAFSEFLKNGRKLFLLNWCRDSIRNYDQTGDSAVATWTQEQMNARSLTKTFTVGSGDTVGFYRFQWFAQRGVSGASFYYYKNPSVLSYSVVLVDSTTGSRIATLDTAEWGATTNSRKPCFYSWYPMYARVRYTLPAGYTNTPVFLQVNTYAVGSTAQPFVRQDRMYSFYSTTYLTNPSITAYCDSVEANITCGPGPACGLTATPQINPTSISISVPTPTTIASVWVYDVFGNQHWQGGVPLSSNPSVVSLTSGLYVVVAYNSTGNVLCTQKVSL